MNIGQNRSKNSFLAYSRQGGILELRRQRRDFTRQNFVLQNLGG